MSGNRWFRMYGEFLTDPKVQMLSEADQRRFVMMLCVHATYPDSTVADSDMAWRLRISNEEWTASKMRIMARGLMSENNKPTYDGIAPASLRPGPAEWSIIRSRIFARDDHTCRYCGQRGGRLQCDHVVPVSRGGDHEDTNLVTSCEACNRAKRDKIVSIQEWTRIRSVKL